MRRLILFGLSVLLSISLIGCSSTADAAKWQEQYDLGVRYLSEGNYEEAIIAFTAAIEIDPNKAEAYVGRGDAYVTKAAALDAVTQADAIEKCYRLAEQDYLCAIELEPEKAEVYQKLADIYVATSSLESALAILEQGVEVTSDDNLAFRVTEYKELVEQQKKAAEIDAANTEADAESVMESRENSIQFLTKNAWVIWNPDPAYYLFNKNGQGRFIYYNGTGNGIEIYPIAYQLEESRLNISIDYGNHSSVENWTINEEKNCIEQSVEEESMGEILRYTRTYDAIPERKMMEWYLEYFSYDLSSDDPNKFQICDDLEKILFSVMEFRFTKSRYNQLVAEQEQWRDAVIAEAQSGNFNPAGTEEYIPYNPELGDNRYIVQVRVRNEQRDRLAELAKLL